MTKLYIQCPACMGKKNLVGMGMMSKYPCETCGAKGIIPNPECDEKPKEENVKTIELEGGATLTTEIPAPHPPRRRGRPRKPVQPEDV